MRVWRYYFSILIMFCVFTGDIQAATTVQDIRAADIEKVVGQHQDMVILDIRTPAEFEEFTLPGAININSLDPGFEGNLVEFMTQHPNVRKWMVYCRSGNRSAHAMPTMQKRLPGMIYHVKDGIISYKKMGNQGN